MVINGENETSPSAGISELILLQILNHRPLKGVLFPRHVDRSNPRRQTVTLPSGAVVNTSGFKLL